MESKKSREGNTVCVTGASGFIASWLVKLLLERGHTVKASVRNLSDSRKTEHLKALRGAEERLRLFEANLTEEGSFDSVVDGCDGVFHTASPVPSSAAIADPQLELIEPAVNGTLNVLRSCSRARSVRRVVLTSSLAAMVVNRLPKGGDVVVDETWFSDAEFCREAEQWYPLSKTMAEEAARKFADEKGIDMVVINPALVLGPLLQPSLNSTSGVVLQIIAGKEIFPTYRFVDVRDVATAHILAYENPSATGRYALVGATMTHSDTLKLLHNLFPSIKAPPPVDTEDSAYQTSRKRAERLGLKFRAVEDSLKETVESLTEKNFLTL
ncbi:phenylacetaldehyde reductase-like [Andrographis paniculata]|uniref:phenylacetaldehyde reductase-like n=1 Tax=Andrographis paniculata TaxID=175694 RepID=UPI0021E7C769|nr:phenylacetaldehyde reductase-like [Andrographis paniculata]